MQEFCERLDEESIDALSLLLGSKIQVLWSPSCEIEAGSSVITVESISIPVKRDIGQNGFVIVRNDWSDTPVKALDYYFLSVRVDSVPRLIAYSPRKLDHLSLHLGAEAQVTKIEILEDSETAEQESVRYDAGLVITRCDGLRFAIVRQNSILGWLQIAHTESEIAQLTADLTVRVAYGAE